MEYRKRAETSELSQMMITIVQSDPALAKMAPRRIVLNNTVNGGTTHPEVPTHPRRSSELEPPSPYILDMPVDMSAMTIEEYTPTESVSDQSESYIFIPDDPRAYYRALVKEVLTYELNNVHQRPLDGGSIGASANRFLSKTSIDLLNEVGMRWRIPYISRLLLVLDVAREKFIAQKVDIQTVDAAFLWLKSPPPERKKGEPLVVLDVTRWTMSDYVLKQQILTAIHDMLLRDLYAELQKCYEAKPPDIGTMMAVLEQHIYDDPLFSKTPEDLNQFGRHLQTALEEKSKSIYQEIYSEQIQANQDGLEFYHIVQLGKEVLKLCGKMQKRYRKTPSIMG